MRGARAAQSASRSCMEEIIDFREHPIPAGASNVAWIGWNPADNAVVAIAVDAVRLPRKGVIVSTAGVRAETWSCIMQCSQTVSRNRRVAHDERRRTFLWTRMAVGVPAAQHRLGERGLSGRQRRQAPPLRVDDPGVHGAGCGANTVDSRSYFSDATRTLTLSLPNSSDLA